MATRDIGQKWTDGLANATIDDYARLPNGFSAIRDCQKVKWYGTVSLFLHDDATFDQFGTCSGPASLIDFHPPDR